MKGIGTSASDKLERPWLHVKEQACLYVNIGFNHAIVSVNYRSSQIYSD